MELARSQLEELKSEVEFERRLRRKAESLSCALAWELSEERAGREATEKVCGELADALVSEREEMERVIEEVEEERKMMRMAEVMREERVRMKLSEAKMAMEEKLREMEEVKELEDAMGMSSSVMGLYGEFDFSMELAEATDQLDSGKSSRGHAPPWVDCGPSSSSSPWWGERSLACKEREYEKAELRLLFLREKKDYMF